MMSARSSLLAIVLALTTTLAVVASPSSAHAQYYDDDAYLWSIYALISSYTGLTTTVAGGVTLTVILLVKALADVEAYVDQNAVALQHDLYLGDGDALRDLATLFGVPAGEHERFASALTGERERLVALMNTSNFDRARAEAFLAVVLDAMRQDAVLVEAMPRFDV